MCVCMAIEGNDKMYTEIYITFQRILSNHSVSLVARMCRAMTSVQAQTQLSTRGSSIAKNAPKGLVMYTVTPTLYLSASWKSSSSTSLPAMLDLLWVDTLIDISESRSRVSLDSLPDVSEPAGD